MSIKRKIGIIGGGIVGSTAAFYLSNDPEVELLVFDDGKGQASSAAAGIISPWLSQRRNKEWYFLAREGAKFYSEYMADLSKYLDTKNIYKKTGTLLYKKTPQLLEKLEKIAYDRREEAPEIGEIEKLCGKEIQERFPFVSSGEDALFITGGAKIDGENLVKEIHQLLKEKNQLKQTRVTDLSMSDKKWVVTTDEDSFVVDDVIVAVGAWLPRLLEPLNMTVDIRPQKGQLIEIQTDIDTTNLPVIMPVGESDIIPFYDGKILVGATHENDEGFDLMPENKLLNQLKETATQTVGQLANYDINDYRVGTRAYTSDFLPFFGEVDGLDNLLVASGLGSSGLTTGPIIGKTMVDWLYNKKTLFESYKQQPNHYIQPKRKGE